MVEAESVKGASEAAASDSKQLARQLLSEGLDVDSVVAQSGLSRPVVLGISGALKKAQKKLAATEDKAAKGSPPGNQEEELTTDFKKESQIANSAVVLARGKQRLQILDPATYKSLYGGGQQPESNTSRVLVDLETARLIRSMRLEQESVGHNNGDSQASGLQKQINDLKEALHQKDVEALQKQSEKLESEVRELREDMRHSSNSNSDLAVVFRESKDLLEKVITHDGVLRSYLLPDNLSLRPPGTAPPLHAQVEPGNGTVISELTRRGLVTRIIQKGGS